jgi:hypothetical protein
VFLAPIGSNAAWWSGAVVCVTGLLLLLPPHISGVVSCLSRRVLALSSARRCLLLGYLGVCCPVQGGGQQARAEEAEGVCETPVGLLAETVSWSFDQSSHCSHLAISQGVRHTGSLGRLQQLVQEAVVPSACRAPHLAPFSQLEMPHGSCKPAYHWQQSVGCAE